LDDTLGDKICVTIIATGFNTKQHKPESPKEEFIKHFLTPDIPEFTEEKRQQPTVEVHKEPYLKTTETTEEIKFIEEEKVYEEEIPEPVLITPLRVEDEKDTEADYFNLSGEEEEEIKENVFKFEIAAPAADKNETVSDENVNSMNEETNDELKEDATEEIFMQKQSHESEPVNIDRQESITAQQAVTEDPHEELFRKSRERIMKLKEMSYRMNSPSGIVDLEKEPAYKRRNIKLENVPDSGNSNISRYTLSEDQDKKVEIKPNNFLHDRVD